ncbi:TPA: glycosyltransferase family 4 protein [Vibrio cholerae]
MKKVALISSGDCVHTLKWCNGLSEVGIDVTLITQQKPLPGFLTDVKIIELPFSGAKGYFLNVFFLSKYLKEHKFDAINVHYVSGYGTLARLSGIKNHIASVWGADVYDFPKKSWFHHWLVEKNLNSASVICSTSEVMGKHVQDTFQLKGGLEVEITPFGINCEVFKKMQREKQCKNLRIGTVKTLRPKYGIDLLIKSFSILTKQYDNITLDIAGIGYQLDELKKLTRELGIEDKVNFLGWVPNEEVPSILNSFDIYVAPSTLDSESFGVAIIEASSCEIPVVVSDVGGLPEVVINKRTGLVVERNNIESITNAIQFLLDNPEERQKMGKNGRQNVLDKYQWNKCVEKMINIYVANGILKND